MLFTQIEFAIFLGLVLLSLIVLRTNLSRKIMLLAASSYFYAYWDVRFLVLIYGCILVNFFASQYLARETGSTNKRRWCLTFALTFSLGTLAAFKYYNFFASSFAAIMGMSEDSFSLTVILPVGISFFTFQALSHTIDTYGKKFTEQPTLLDFALYVCFFPQLVAGPIVRSSEFLGQLREFRPLSYFRLASGLQIFAVGFFKKTFIADNLATFVDPVFSCPEIFGATTILLAVLAYAIQIYCDFSGYSEMAIGTAKLIGYDFCPNFNLPYSAISLSDFWRRWHISLSSWLRDYLYIPLGGNRHGYLRTKLNLVLTMTLGGLWHGAAWTFVVWGLWHGLALAVQNLAKQVGLSSSNRLVTYIATMMVVLVGWVFFRAESFTDVVTIFGRVATFQTGVSWNPLFVISVVALTWGWHLLNVLRLTPVPDLSKPSRAVTVLALFQFWLAIVFRPATEQAFIYFQF